MTCRVLKYLGIGFKRPDWEEFLSSAGIDQDVDDIDDDGLSVPEHIAQALVKAQRAVLTANGVQHFFESDEIKEGREFSPLRLAVFNDSLDLSYPEEDNVIGIPLNSSSYSRKPVLIDMKHKKGLKDLDCWQEGHEKVAKQLQAELAKDLPIFSKAQLLELEEFS